MRRVRFLLPVLVALLCGAIAPSAVFAAADGESTPLNLPDAESASQASGGSGGGSILRTIGGLLIVCAVIYGLTWVLKQIRASKEAKAGGTGLENIATLPLGAGQALHLVRAGRQIVLVGTSEKGVVPIRVYEEAEARALGLLAPESRAAALAAEGPVPKPVRGLLEELRAKTVIK